MTIRRSFALLVPFVLATSIAACADKPAPTTNEVESSSDAATSFSKNWKIVGSLDYGQTSGPVAYTHSPRYRAFKFAGAEGDVVDVTVHTSNGDAVAWLLDNDFKTLAHNDDASAKSTDSHITATLPANASATHYIVFRDADLGNATFTVKLDGKKKPVDFFSCNKDADCVAAPVAACCKNGYNAAVNKDQVDAYEASVTCAPHPICPLYIVNDTRVAECNVSTHKCEMVQPEDVRCGGFTTNPHQCAPGYSCILAHIPDVPGTCEKHCGGIAGIKCDAGFTCVDDPTDSCDPTKGGADCGGVCEKQKTCGGIAGLKCDAGFTCVDDPNDSCDPAKGGADCGGICQKNTCVQTVLCTTTSHFDTSKCACVPNTCVQTVLCTTTSHFDTSKCACVPNTCVQTQLCIKTSHWDSTKCACVAN
jgi:hypothetical protein